MATDKQLAANRLNSLKSTGPRTPEGKAITRLNAVRDGLTGQLTIVPREEHAIFVALSQHLTASLDPTGPQELHIAARIVRDTWRLHRIAANEENIYTLDLVENDTDLILTETGTASTDRALAVAVCNSRTFMTRTRDFERASLIEQRLKRGLHKDYALFRQLQRDRNLPATRSAPRSRHIQYPTPAPVDREPGCTLFERSYGHSKETTSRPNGFVFPEGPKDRFGFPLGLKIEPQVVNSTHPYVNPWPGINHAKYAPVIQDPYWPY